MKKKRKKHHHKYGRAEEHIRHLVGERKYQGAGPHGPSKYTRKKKHKKGGVYDEPCDSSSEP